MSPATTFVSVAFVTSCDEEMRIPVSPLPVTTESATVVATLSWPAPMKMPFWRLSRAVQPCTRAPTSDWEAKRRRPIPVCRATESITRALAFTRPSMLMPMPLPFTKTFRASAPETSPAMQSGSPPPQIMTAMCVKPATIRSATVTLTSDTPGGLVNTSPSSKVLPP